MLFVGAMAIGLGPFVLAVVATPFVPALQDPTMQQRVGVVLYAVLASVVPITAYSVAVDRVMVLQFLIREHVAARPGAVRRLGHQPRAAAYVGFDIQANQHLTVAQYLERFRPTGPLALSTAGLIALVFPATPAPRHRPLVSSRTIRPVANPCPARTAIPRGDTLRGVTGALAKELNRALQPRRWPSC